MSGQVPISEITKAFIEYKLEPRNAQPSNFVRPTSETTAETSNAEKVTCITSGYDGVILVGMIIIAGCIGGIVNSSLERKQEQGDIHFHLKNVAIGIGAAFLVPLFLKSVDSNILERTLFSISSALVFFGYCVLAAISARHFITTLTNQIFKTVAQLEKQAATTTHDLNNTKSIVEKTRSESQAAKTIAMAASDTARLQTIELPNAPLGGNAPPAIIGITQQEYDAALREEDPWKGRFGQKSQTNGRILEGYLTHIDEQPILAVITLTVKSTDATKPLTGLVQLFLHPSFKNFSPEIPVQKGSATLRIVSTGAFTVGAICDGGLTKLELNLAELPEAWEPWKSL